MKSWHARALAPANAATVVGDFRGAHFQGTSSEAWMEMKDSLYIMRTGDASGEVHNYPVAWVIGGKRMQDPVTVFPDGRWQVLPIYYHTTTKEWVDYNERKQGPVSPDHPFFWTNFRRMANRECLDCHSTGLEVSYDRVAKTFSTKFTEPGVACECCHGPGRRHAESGEPADIVHPRKVGAELGLAICAQCHGPREPIFPVLQAAHRFRPGRPYDDYYRVLMVTVGPELSSDFFPDGRPNGSSFEYQGLLQSRCYREGSATCLTCHTAPHAAHGKNDLKLPQRGSPTPLRLGDASCRQCHAAVVNGAAAHSHHRSPAAQSCVACHMPPILSGVLDKFADHSLDVPVPENTIHHRVPNACNECHAKETPETMAAALHRWWPQAQARQKRRLLLAEAFDPERTGRNEPALRAVVTDSLEAPTLRVAAATLLAVAYPREAVTILAPLLNDTERVLRAGIAYALGYLPIDEAQKVVPWVRPLVHDSYLPARESAALLLAFANAPDGEEALRTLADDPATQDLPQPHYELAIRAGRRGALAEAETELQKTLDRQFYHTFALVALADLYEARQQPELAHQALVEAIRFGGPDPRVEQRLQQILGR
jgi:hypothetical protein